MSFIRPDSFGVNGWDTNVRFVGFTLLNQVVSPVYYSWNSSVKLNNNWASTGIPDFILEKIPLSSNTFEWESGVVLSPNGKFVVIGG